MYTWLATKDLLFQFSRLGIHFYFLCLFVAELLVYSRLLGYIWVAGHGLSFYTSAPPWKSVYPCVHVYMYSIYMYMYMYIVRVHVHVCVFQSYTVHVPTYSKYPRLGVEQWSNLIITSSHSHTLCRGTTPASYSLVHVYIYSVP